MWAFVNVHVIVCVCMCRSESQMMSSQRLYGSHGYCTVGKHNAASSTWHFNAFHAFPMIYTVFVNTVFLATCPACKSETAKVLAQAYTEFFRCQEAKVCRYCGSDFTQLFSRDNGSHQWIYVQNCTNHEPQVRDTSFSRLCPFFCPQPTFAGWFLKMRHGGADYTF